MKVEMYSCKQAQKPTLALKDFAEPSELEFGVQLAHRAWSYGSPEK
jgi:hypothetical protein